jgi:dihydrolipoamide dehydrogenase
MSVDVVVLGGGPGGYTAAARAAGAGRDVVLIERGELGGVCLNEGCIPSKALIQGGWLARRAAQASWIDGQVRADLRQLQTVKGAIVAGLRRGVEQLLRSSGVHVRRGDGVVEGPNRVRVDDEVIACRSLVLSTGSVERALPALPIDGEGVLSARDALELEEVPEQLVVVGGGYIGVELAGLFADLGAAVTLIEVEDDILPGFEHRIAQAVGKDLQRRGVALRTGHRVQRMVEGTVHASAADGQSWAGPADRVIVAVGRRPRAREAGIPSIGAAVGSGGFLTVDSLGRTSVPGVFAIGDLTPGPGLAHKATADARRAVDALVGRPSPGAPAGIPAVVYAGCDAATVGLGVAGARAQGLRAASVVVPMRSNPMALIGDDGRGVAELVYAEDTGLVLGLHVAGHGAAEVIGLGALALEMGAVVDDLAEVVLPHPSLAEVVSDLAGLAMARGGQAGVHSTHASDGDRSGIEPG